jgi:hypothetical protein
MAFVSSTFAPYVPPLKDRILAAQDRVTVVFYTNPGTCEELITEIQYYAPSVSTANLFKRFTYAQTGYRFFVDTVTWEIEE